MPPSAWPAISPCPHKYGPSNPHSGVASSATPIPRFPPPRLVRRLPGLRRRVIRDLRVRAGIGQPLTEAATQDMARLRSPRARTVPKRSATRIRDMLSSRTSLDLIHCRVCILENLIGIVITTKQNLGSNAGGTLMMDIPEDVIGTQGTANLADNGLDIL